MDRIPITIITGYLGAGKTTLLRSLLAHAQALGLPIAVIMNEFGSVSIDSQVIKGANFELVELAGGCVCCSLSGEFDAALAELAQRPNPPQHIIVETTGLAEPDALIVELEQERDQVRLDSVVTMVDCDALTKSPSLGHTGRVQVEMADLLVLSKTDLVSSEQVETVRTQVSEINPRAHVLINNLKNPVDPAIIFDAKSGPRETHKLFEVGLKHLHPMQATSIVVECSQPLSEERFSEFAYGIPSQIYRAKGFVCLDDGRTMLFNFVSGRFSLEEWEQDKSLTQVVFIAPGGMDESTMQAVEQGLMACGQQ